MIRAVRHVRPFPDTVRGGDRPRDAPCAALANTIGAAIEAGRVTDIANTVANVHVRIQLVWVVERGIVVSTVRETVPVVIDRLTTGS